MSDGVDLQHAFDSVVSALKDSATEYAFIGALAAVAWGRARTTTDIDLVMACESTHLALLDEALRRRGLTRGTPVGPTEPSDPLPDIAIYWSAGRPQVRVDVFLAKTRFEEAVLASKRTAEVLGRQVQLASPEAIVVYKALANRGKDTFDLEGLFEAQREAGATLDWGFIDRWAHEWQISERLAVFRAKYGPSSP